MLKDATCFFYQNNANDLIFRYDSANMSELHVLLKSLFSQGSKVLDIGFGSGRDLSFLNSIGYEVYGTDPVDIFVNNAKKRFSGFSDNFFVGSFTTKFPEYMLQIFDGVISIAVWMHLHPYEYEIAIKNIKSLLKKKGLFVLSFSVGKRDIVDKRHFEVINVEEVVSLFEREGFSQVLSHVSDDTLGRGEIQWITKVFQL